MNFEFCFTRSNFPNYSNRTANNAAFRRGVIHFCQLIAVSFKCQLQKSKGSQARYFKSRELYNQYIKLFFIAEGTTYLLPIEFLFWLFKDITTECSLENKQPCRYLEITCYLLAKMLGDSKTGQN